MSEIAARWHLPFFRRLNLTSDYEYLKVRFNLGCRASSRGTWRQADSAAIHKVVTAVARKKSGRLNATGGPMKAEIELFSSLS